MSEEPLMSVKMTTETECGKEEKKPGFGYRQKNSFTGGVASSIGEERGGVLINQHTYYRAD